MLRACKNQCPATMLLMFQHQIFALCLSTFNNLWHPRNYVCSMPANNYRLTYLLSNKPFMFDTCQQHAFLHPKISLCYRIDNNQCPASSNIYRLCNQALYIPTSRLCSMLPTTIVSNTQ